jgi:hypothetical protein
VERVCVSTDDITAKPSDIITASSRMAVTSTLPRSSFSLLFMVWNT